MVSEIDPEFLQQLQEAFVIEAREQLQTIMTNIITMEGNQDEAAKLTMAENILHELHSLKGNSRAAGINNAEMICQFLESAILSLRRKKELLTADAADVFHKAIDILDEIINKVEAGQSDYQPEAFTETLQLLKILDERQRLLMEAAAEENATAAAEPPTAAQKPEGAVQESKADPDAGAREQAGKASKQPSSGDKSASTRIALWKLDKMLRESEEMLVLKQISEQHLEDLRDLRSVARSMGGELERLSNLVKARKIQDSDSHAERLLLSMQQTLSTLTHSLEQSLSAKMRRQNTEQRLCFNLVDGFIDSVKSMLMQDFSSLLSIVPKVVRDLSRELHKEVDLEIFGTEIEIDRRILEEIKDPVIHLVRNSMDHGIESSEKRIAAGKPARAILKIGARQDESGYVQFIISDDGRGISAERLKSAALKEGAITSEEAAAMTDSDAIELMYRSSVSTSETVTEISGRGLGMAIVRERIHELGGRVLLETELGRGTTFILQLPTKLSTFRGIQVMAAGQSFIIPTLHVHYAGRVHRSEIGQNGSRSIANINGQLTSVQALADVLQIESRQEFKVKAARNYQQLLVLEAAERRAGFLVDEILHEQEVLVRGLSYPLVRVPNISGATILGSGQVVPVLNIVDLIETSNKANWADERLLSQLSHDESRTQKLSEQPVFLVDRHSTSLVMLRTLLEAEGYKVQSYDSNESALEGLNEDVPLLLLKSTELPETQESGLAYWVRRDLRLKDLPVVFFGSESVNDGQKLAEQQGGNAYFSKLDFNRNQILELIERLT